MHGPRPPRNSTGGRPAHQTGRVSIRLRRPVAAALRPLQIAGQAAALTYEPVGMSGDALPPSGYRLDRFSRVLGRGDRVFEAAADALRRWRIHEGSGLVVLADGPPAVGSVVAIAAPMLIGYIDVVCRVVDVVDRPDRFGFTYGTLPVHPEQGEESFTVVRQPDDEIVFHVVAVSRPRHPLARMCPPIARRMQRAATVKYLDAMQAEVARD